MSVNSVISRINDIQRQFGAVRAGAGYEAAQSATAPGGTVSGAGVPTAKVTDGVIVGSMGGPATLEVVQEQQQRLAGVGQVAVSNLSSPLPQVELGSGYGMRLHPIHGDYRMHHGVDLDADSGTPISALSDGVVTFAGERGGYGNLVIIDHGGGYETRYAHQEALSVTAGDLVRAGDTLGYVGSTGNSTGPHLHLEVRRDGESVDPEPWLGAL